MVGDIKLFCMWLAPCDQHRKYSLYETTPAIYCTTRAMPMIPIIWGVGVGGLMASNSKSMLSAYKCVKYVDTLEQRSYAGENGCAPFNLRRGYSTFYTCAEWHVVYTTVTRLPPRFCSTINWVSCWAQYWHDHCKLRERKDSILKVAKTNEARAIHAHYR